MAVPVAAPRASSLALCISEPTSANDDSASSRSARPTEIASKVDFERALASCIRSSRAAFVGSSEGRFTIDPLVARSAAAECRERRSESRRVTCSDLIPSVILTLAS